jgi:transcriptional regulator with XRE-family HTH domain
MADPRRALKAWRKKSRLTQQQAAERIGCSKPKYSFIERGTQLPGRHIANRIKAVAGISTESWDELERAS